MYFMDGGMCDGVNRHHRMWNKGLRFIIIFPSMSAGL